MKYFGDYANLVDIDGDVCRVCNQSFSEDSADNLMKHIKYHGIVPIFDDKTSYWTWATRQRRIR